MITSFIALKVSILGAGQPSALGQENHPPRSALRQQRALRPLSRRNWWAARQTLFKQIAPDFSVRRPLTIADFDVWPTAIAGFCMGAAIEDGARPYSTQLSGQRFESCDYSQL
jgi:hypothetical protein